MSSSLPYFLVPVELKALMVNNISYNVETSQWKDFKLNYKDLGKKSNLLGDDLEASDLFNSTKFIEPGIHLHWTLPAALTHGIYYQDDLNFPTVPNRWLILRMEKEQDELIHKAWVVESDFTKDDARSPNWLAVNPEGVYKSKKIGKVTALDNWEKTDDARDPLTAMAPGNASFSAYYKSCQNVFGFYDNLEGLDNDQNRSFTYMLVGWYASVNLDPLNPNEKEDKDLWKIRLEDLKNRWQHPETWPEGGHQTLCYSTLHQVKWSNNNDRSPSARKAAVNLAMAETPVEGLSARISKQTQGDEKLLSAFQYDLLKEVKTRDEIHAQVHERGFAPIRGGTLWEIEASEEAKDKDGNILDSFPSLDFFEGDEQKLADLRSEFIGLNQDQSNLDKHLRRKDSLQVAFRAEWDRQIINGNLVESIKESQQIISLTLEIDQLQQTIDRLTLKLGTDQDDFYQYGTSQVSIQRLLGYSEERIEDNDGNIAIESSGKYKLSQKKMPNFWQPKDPALLFYGPGIDLAEKIRDGEINQKLKGRILAGIVNKIQLQAQGLTPVWVAATDPLLPVFPLDGQLDLPLVAIQELYYEMLLMNSEWSEQMAKAYFVNIGRGTDPNFKNLSSAIEDFLNLEKEESQTDNRVCAFQSSGNSETTTAEEILERKKKDYFKSIGQYLWKAPWAPIYLLWEAEWFPDYTENTEKWEFDFQHWDWDGKSYKWKGTAPHLSPKITYEGKTLLTNAAEQLLKGKLQGFDKLNDINLLSQSIEGLTDSMLMQKQGIRLPLLEDVEGGIKPITRFEKYESENHYFLPDLSTNAVYDFFPVRAGHLKIKQLWLVDAFGQIQYVAAWNNTEEKTTFAVSPLAAKDNNSNEANLFRLPPRICQASRLNFRWKSVNDPALDANSDPATSPVIGWLLYQRIDESLWVCDQDGKALGELFYTSNNQSFGWRNAPLENNSSLSGEMNDVVKNPDLLQFLQQLKSSTNSWNLLKTSFEDLDNSLEQKGAKRANALAHQISQPLVLAKAAVSLETLGLPSYPQTDTTEWKRESENQARGMEEVLFNLNLGNTSNRNDGLVGFFLDDAPSKMHLCQNVTIENHSYFSTENIKLKINEDAVKLTLLLDPRGGVTARTGVLPEKYIELPEVFTVKPLDRLELYIQATPILSNAEEISLPLSQSPNDWSWLFLDQEGNWGQKEIMTGIPKNDFSKLSLQEGFIKLNK